MSSDGDDGGALSSSDEQKSTSVPRRVSSTAKEAAKQAARQATERRKKRQQERQQRQQQERWQRKLSSSEAAASSSSEGEEGKEDDERDKAEFDCGYRKDLLSTFELGPVIGAGGQGVVRVGIEKITKHKFAIKSVPKMPSGFRAGQGYSQKLRRVRNLRREVDIQLLLGRSLNVVTLFDVFEDDESVHLQLELCEGGALYERSDLASGTFNEDAAIAIARAVLQSVAQCHAHHIAFRDVKPENFMYLRKDDPTSPLKLSDFGMSKFQKPSDAPYKTKCGTVAFVAPEVLQRSAGLAADLWSCGVLLYQLLTGKLPFVDNEGATRMASEVFSAILSSDPNFTGSPWDDMPEARELVEALLQKDPSARPSAKDALQSAWLSPIRNLKKLGKGKDGDADDDTTTLAKNNLDGTVVARLQRFATAGALRRRVLTSVAAQLEGRREEVQGLRELFADLDREERGRLREADLVWGLSERGYNVSTNEVRELFVALDVDGSGDIGLAEFIAALTDWSTLQQSADWSAWARTAFNNIREHAGVGEDSEGIAPEVLADEVCQVDFTAPGGLVCRQAVLDILKEAAAVKGGMVRVEEFVELCESDSEDDVSLYDARIAD